MRLGMKSELEARVMSCVCLAKWENGVELRFTDIAKITKIPKSTLQRVLPRLEKRGWIRKAEKWINIPQIPLHYDIKNKNILELDNQVKREIKDSMRSDFETIPYERRRRISKKVKSGVISKKIIVFEFQEFPYLIDGKNMRLGTKRMWKIVAKIVKDYARENKLKPFLVKHALIQS